MHTTGVACRSHETPGSGGGTGGRPPRDTLVGGVLEGAGSVAGVVAGVVAGWLVSAGGAAVVGSTGGGGVTGSTAVVGSAATVPGPDVWAFVVAGSAALVVVTGVVAGSDAAADVAAELAADGS